MTSPHPPASRAPHERTYFRRRHTVPSERHPFERGYYCGVVDPDGRTRDQRLERSRYLEDVSAELYAINRMHPGRVLDVGCGLGFLLSGIDSRWEKHGVEISQFAARHAGQHGTVRCGTLHDAHYADGYFDVVVAYHVIEHVADPVGLVREMYRVLRPGGTLMVGTPDFDSACARRFGDRFRLLSDQTHISLFSEASLRRLLEDEGLQVDYVDFPFFETRHFTADNLLRLQDTSHVSPPFYGNVLTAYATKPAVPPAVRDMATAGRILSSLATHQASPLAQAVQWLAAARTQQQAISVEGKHSALATALLTSSGWTVASEHTRAQAALALTVEEEPDESPKGGEPPKRDQQPERRIYLTTRSVGSHTPTSVVLALPELGGALSSTTWSAVVAALLGAAPSEADLAHSAHRYVAA